MDAIICEEGIGAVTIRKAADRAGFTSGTLYNYFDNLTTYFLATMNHLEKYNAALPEFFWPGAPILWNGIWRCASASLNSHTEPEIFERFSHNEMKKLEEYTKQYYELFPEKTVKDGPPPLYKIFHVNNIYSRSSLMLDDCVEEGYLTPERAADFNDVALMVFKCILQDVFRQAERVRLLKRL